MSLPNPESSSSSSIEFWDELDTDVSGFNTEDQNILPKPDQAQASIRNWLNPTQYDGNGSEYQKHLSSHLRGTGNWVFESDIYRQWHDSDEHGIFWIRGIPGAGKSVLGSTLIHHFQKEENVPVLYFFFRHALDANNSPDGLLRDWLAQVLQYSPPLQHELSARDSRNPLNDPSTQNLSLGELWRYLRRALINLPKVYCVIDAVDEMDPERLEPLVRSLDALGRWRPAKIKLVVTSRPVAVVEKIFSRRRVKTLDVRLDKKSVEGDITRYIQHRLGLSSIPAERHQEIVHAILQRADGLFLYAKLALDSILHQQGTNVLTNLVEIPADLTKMYTNLLQLHSRKQMDSTQVGERDQGLQEFVLQLVTHATRPLRLLEIADVVRLTQTQKKGDDDTGAIKDHIRSLCGPLLEILPDESVRVVHHSLTEYLTGMTPSIPDGDIRVFPVFDFAATHHRLATTCLSYLSSGCLDSVTYSKRRQISGDVNYIKPAVLKTDQVLPPFTRYAGSNWAVHVRRAMSAGHSDQTQVNEMLDGLLIESNLDKLDVLIGTEMDFQPSALHFAIGLELKGYARRLLSLSSDKKSRYVKDGRLQDDSLILYAAMKGNEFIVRLLLDHGANPAPRNHRGRTPLHLAVISDHTKVAAVLLDAGVDPDIARGDDNYYGMPGEGEMPWTPLEHVFSRGSFDMALVFSQHVQSPRAVTKALWHAIYNRNTREVVELLLQHPKLDINAYYQDETPIFAACLNHDVDMIELLFKAGAMVKPSLARSRNLESSSRLRSVAAFEDSEKDYDDMMDVDAANEDRCSNVLHAWARGNGKYPEYKRRKLNNNDDDDDEKEVARGVRMLLAHGADGHQFDENGKTPLHLASDDATTVRSLLEGGANPNAVDSAGKTLLHISNTKEILDVLLPRADLDLNLATRSTKHTPLLYTLIDDNWAPEATRVEKALRLIGSGADVTAVDRYGNSALHLAVGMANDVAKVGIIIPLIEKLCSFGSDVVNLKNYQGKTPLHMNAPGSGRVNLIGYDSGCFNAQILHVLLAAGADINARDSCGKTLLFQYMENGGGSYPRNKDPPVFDTVVQAGAKIDTLDLKGRSLLHAQVHNFYCETSLLELMVNKDVDPTRVDYDGNTLLHEAMPKLAKMVPKTGSPSLVEKLIEMGVDPRRPNHLGRTPLHILTAFNPGSFDPSNSYTSHSSGSRPSNADDPCGFDFYLRLCPDLVDRPDKHGVRPLHFASTFSEYITRRLLEEGASPSKATEEGLTPLHLAARSRQTNIIGILLDKLQATLSSTPDELIAILNAKDTLNRTALYYAAASGRVESFQLLLEAGATLNHDSYIGSCWNGCANFEEELDNWPHQTDPDDRLFKRKDYNHIQVNAGGVMVSDTARPHLPRGRHHQLEQDLFPTERLDEILDILSSSSMSKHQIGLMDQAIASATEKSYDYTVECLLRARDRLIGPKGDLGEKTQACLNRRQEKRPPSGPTTSDRNAMIRLMKSRDYGVASDRLTPTNCLESASPLVSQFALGGFTNLVSKVGSLEVTAKTEWREVVDRKTRQQGLYMQPLLISACSREMPNMDVIRTLVEDKKVDINARKPMPGRRENALPNGPTALHYLAAGEHWWQTAQAIPYLVRHGADLDAVEQQNGLTPLGYALRSINGPHFSRRTVETLLALGASPNRADRSGNSYLSWTIKHPKIFQLLVQHGAVITRSALSAAIYQQDVNLVQMLLSNGADPNERKVAEERPEILHSENSMSSARTDPSSQDELYLVELVAGEFYRRDEKGREVDDRICKILLEHGADPFAPYSRTTVLHRVMENRGLNTYVSGHNRRLDLLLDQPGLNFDTRDADGMTLLLLAAKRDFGVSDESTIRIIQKLLDRGADIYARDYKGRSAMHHASCFKMRCDFFLGKAPELMDSPDHEGKTPLHHALATAHGHAEDVAYALIAAGADAAHPDHEGKTPLHLALARSNWTIQTDVSVGGPGRNMFDLLVANGADVNARTLAGETPIFDYVRSSHIRAETDISELGPKEEASTIWKWNMAKLHLEQKAGLQKEGVLWRFLEQQDVDLHAVNEAGEGLLHLLAQDTDSRGRALAQFKFLMEEKGLDPAMEDKEHRTPIDLAAALGREDLLALFKRDE